MPKVQSLKGKAQYRGPYSRGKFYAASVQLDWQGPVFHYKDGLFWKKLAFKDVTDWSVAAEPGGKPDKFGRLKILHIIKLRTKNEKHEFALPPENFETWLYWVIRSVVKHSNIVMTDDDIKKTPLMGKHKVKATAFQDLSFFERTHQNFMNAVNILSNPEEVKKLPSGMNKGEGGATFGRIVKKIGKGGSNAIIFEILKQLDEIKIGGKNFEEPVAVKVGSIGNLDAGLNKDAVNDLIKEVRVLALLGKHSNIVGLVDTVIAENRLCFFMELGTSLKDRTAQNFRSRDAVRLAQDILDGISHMHSRRTYHLDMKRENVIVCMGDKAKIIDFGLAKSKTLESKEKMLDETWSRYGTVGYIPPESFDNKAYKKEDDLEKRDAFAVGMTIFTGLLGPYYGWNEIPTANLGEPPNVIKNRIKHYQNLVRNEQNRKNLIRDRLLILADAASGMIEADPKIRLAVKDALEFVKADRKQHRQAQMSDGPSAVTAKKEFNYFKSQLK